MEPETSLGPAEQAEEKPVGDEAWDDGAEGQETEGPPSPRRRPTARQVFGVLAMLLAAVLIALLVYLFYFARRGWPGGPETPGIVPIMVIDGPGTGPKPKFDSPMAVAFARDGSIYVADSGNDRICVFDEDGGFLYSFGRKGVAKPAGGGAYSWAPGRLNYPLGMATDRFGYLYVADFYNDQVQVFTAAGRPLRRFPDPRKVTGKGGSGLYGRGIAVTDVAATRDRVYATDAWQVFAFDASGTVVAQFGKPGSGPTDMDHPNGVAVGRDGAVYVADSNHSRLLALDASGNLEWSVGAPLNDARSAKSSPLKMPRDLAVTPAGNVLVCDTFGFQIVAVSPEGEVIGRYGQRGTYPGQFNFPNGIAMSRGLVAIADRGNDRVQVVRLIGVD